MEFVKTLSEIFHNIAIALGVIVAGYLFYLRSEFSPHVEVSLAPTVSDNCDLSVDLNLKNVSGVPLTVSHVAIVLREPVFEQKRTPETKYVSLARQYRESGDPVKIGESYLRSFHLRLDQDLSGEMMEISAVIRVIDDGWIPFVGGGATWTEILEKSVYFEKCKQA